MSKTALPPGVLSLHVLPADHHDRDWDNIVVPREVKERLLNQALLTLLHGRKLSMLAGLPHGLIVLAGPPGTGKTTLARGLAQVAALALAARGATTLLEINPHALPSDMLGESQRNITRLMQDTIPEIAARRPHTVVLIDEVEAFAVRRAAASFETNPVDVHRATDAILLGIDEIARSIPPQLRWPAQRRAQAGGRRMDRRRIAARTRSVSGVARLQALRRRCRARTWARP